VLRRGFQALGTRVAALVIVALIGTPGCAPVGPQTDSLGLGIVGGDETSGWPAVAAYMVNGGAGGMCTATLVRPDVMLTAAHCVDESTMWDMVVFAPDIYDSNSNNTYDVAQAIAHPNYFHSDTQIRNDMAVLLMQDKVDDVDFIPVNTVEMDDDWVGDIMHYVGYGSNTTYGGPGGGQKRETDIEVNDVYDDSFVHYSVGTNTCSGDSGGPAFVNHDGHWYVVGVVSYGFATQSGQDTCSGGGVEMRPDAELDFLSEYFDPYDDPYLNGDDDDSVSMEDLPEPIIDEFGYDEPMGMHCQAGAGSGKGWMAMMLAISMAWIWRRRTYAPAGLLLVAIGLGGCHDNRPPLDPSEFLQIDRGIVGGDETMEWPAVVAYWIDGGYGGMCTATLIHPDVALTAAHCVDQSGWRDEIFFGYDIYDMANHNTVDVAEAIAHPQYSSWGHDIAVLLLEEEVDDVQWRPVNTTEVDWEWRGQMQHHVGFGSSTTYSGGGSGTKRETDIEIYDYEDEYLIHYTTGTNTCSGDSGGPAFVEIEGKLYVSGVASSVFPVSDGQDSCHGGGIDMRVDANLDFLEQYIDPYLDPDDIEEEVVPAVLPEPIIDEATYDVPAGMHCQLGSKASGSGWWAGGMLLAAVWVRRRVRGSRRG